MSDGSLSCPHRRTRTLPPEFQRRPPLAVSPLPEPCSRSAVRSPRSMFGMPNIAEVDTNDPALVAAHGHCPRIPASSSPRRFAAPEPCRRSTARRPPSMFGVPNITEVDGTIPPSWPHEDFALEVSTVVLRPPPPSYRKPKIHSARRASPHGRCMNFLGSIKGKISAVDSRLGFLGVRHAEHERKLRTER